MPDTATDMPLVARTDHDGFVTITMNNPSRRNALSGAMMTALQQAFEQIANETDIRCVILAAEGPEQVAHDNAVYPAELRAGHGRGFVGFSTEE